ncbi:MAG: hypothetical protein GY793_11945 [Proteobacteria bacterium]|nr:hypothetical protein [Pseudomonadota bacterium]
MVKITLKDSLDDIIFSEVGFANKHFPERVKNLLVCNTVFPYYTSPKINRVFNTEALQLKKDAEIKEIMESGSESMASMTGSYVKKGQKQKAVIDLFKHSFNSRSVSANVIILNDKMFHNSIHDARSNEEKMIDRFLYSMGRLLANTDDAQTIAKRAERYRCLRLKQIFGKKTNVIGSSGSYYVSDQDPYNYVQTAAATCVDDLSKLIVKSNYFKNSQISDMSDLTYKETVSLVCAPEVTMKTVNKIITLKDKKEDNKEYNVFTKAIRPVRKFLAA